MKLAAAEEVVVGSNRLCLLDVTRRADGTGRSTAGRGKGRWHGIGDGSLKVGKIFEVQRGSNPAVANDARRSTAVGCG